MITLHRRESFGQPLLNIIEGLLLAARNHPEVEFWWPTHPNPAVQALLPETECRPANLYLIPPVPYPTFVRLLARSQAVLTDSGGVQEEAATLGIPACIAREVTDRPESVDAGLAVVVGRTVEGVAKGLGEMLGWPNRGFWYGPSKLFGDGKAGPRIVRFLQDAMG